ncbi:3-oxo-tetronate kinase [Georgenia faecalis]|uniref:3-oxo-tetronate kinase n=1 Tax=Georgenia faecalis TaxID=2483799 RepID=A0ABV9D5Q5_9MICO|nr:3-oxo-tetronate kinase [Georgenia faecalis]
MSPWLGIIADDVTGACDVAAAVRAAGHATVLKLGVPELFEPLPECDVVVIGLPIRNAAPDDARGQARAGAMWLRDRGVGTYYQKYCSTFDSSPHGNIGPVADALAELVAGWGANAPPIRSVGTPATPTAGRTQYEGHLFVHGRLLSESSLRDHPLTPMRDPDLVRVLTPQTRTPVRLVRWGTVQQGARAVQDAALAGDAHVLVDALTDADLDVLAQALLSARTPPLVGGGAGLAGALARARPPVRAAACEAPPVEPGERLIVSGSLSEATHAQLAAFTGVRLVVDPLDGGRARCVQTVTGQLRAAYRERPGTPVLVCAPSDPERVRSYQDRLGPDDAGRLVSGALAEVAARAVRDLGVRRLVVAGGETSGAVTRALGVRSLHVGESVSPGVPWTVATGTPHVALLLKPENFGPTDLFEQAWAAEP